MIRQVNPSDLASVAFCHKRSFTSSLSSAMGLRYLQSMLSWYLDSPYGFIFMEQSDEGTKGYCGGIVVNGKLPFGSASSMAQHSFEAAVLAFIQRPWLLFHREMFRKYRFVFRNIWYRIVPPEVKSRPDQETAAPHTGLVVIGVDPEFQGQGIGQKLLLEFERRTKEMDIHLMKLTVKADNGKAIGAYKKSGWEIFSNDGKSVGMQKRIA